MKKMILTASSICFVGFVALELVIDSYYYGWFFEKIGYHPLAQADLKRICTLSLNYTLSESDSPEKKREAILYLFFEAESQIKSQSVKNVLAALSHVAPQDRWEIFRQSGIELGLKDFECDSLKKLFIASHSE